MECQGEGWGMGTPPSTTPVHTLSLHDTGPLLVYRMPINSTVGFGYSLLLFCDVQVGGQVEVRQVDGQVQQGTITKLTDHSTYTVGESFYAWHVSGKSA